MRHHGGDADAAQRLCDRAVRMIESELAHLHGEHGLTGKQFFGGERGADDRQHAGKNDVQIARKLEQCEQRSERRLQGRTHHRTHAEHGVKPGLGRRHRNQAVADIAEHPARGGAHDQRGSDQASGQAGRDADSRRQEFDGDDGGERAKGKASDQRKVDCVIADTHHLGHRNTAATDEHAGGDDAHPPGTVAHCPRQLAHQHDKRCGERAYCNAHGDDVGKLPQ